MSCTQSQGGSDGRNVKPAPDSTQAGLALEIPAATRQFLLTLGRRSLEAAVRQQPPPRPADIPAFARDNYGCFVTLTKKGELRGCIGYLEGIKPLWEAVVDNAGNAALNDSRFSPVTPDELAGIKLEVSVLTAPVPLPYGSPEELLAKLVPGEDGVILHSGWHQSTYLPQVWDHFRGDKVKFLESLAMKGGMPADGWKTASVKRYRAVHFSEP
jgi:AmmeMemoRadiSam system protein A